MIEYKEAKLRKITVRPLSCFCSENKLINGTCMLAKINPLKSRPQHGHKQFFSQYLNLHMWSFHLCWKKSPIELVCSQKAVLTCFNEYSKTKAEKDIWNRSRKWRHPILANTALSVWSSLISGVTRTLISSNHVHTFAISAQIITQRAFIYIWKRRIAPISCPSKGWFCNGY